MAEPIQLTMEGVEELFKRLWENTVKQYGLDKIDRKYGMFPNLENKGDINQRFGAFIKAVMRHDNDYLRQNKELVEGSSSGSYTVPVEYADFISRAAGLYGVARRECTILNPISNSMKIPDETAVVTIYCPGETTALTASDPTLAQKTLTMKVAGGFTVLSNELLQDNIVDLMGYIASLFGQELALFEDTHTFGNSTSYFTPMLGLTSAGTVTIGSTSITGVTAEEINKMRRQVNPKYWPGAKFFMHPYTLSYVEELKGTDGHFIVRQPADSAQPRTLWGHPIVTCDGMPSTDASATAFIGFGNAKRCFFGQRKGIELKISEDATVSTSTYLFEENMSALRVLERFGQVWANEAGTCYLKTAS